MGNRQDPLKQRPRSHSEVPDPLREPDASFEQQELKLRAQEVFIPLAPDSGFLKRHEQTLALEDRAVVCVFGGAATGKGTTCSKFAEEIGAAYIDSGALFRTISLIAQREGFSASAEKRLLTPDGRPVEDDEEALAALVYIARNLPIRFKEQYDNASPAILFAVTSLSGEQREDYIDISSQIRDSNVADRLKPEILAATVRIQPIRAALYEFLREITPDQAVVEGRSNIFTEVYRDVHSKTALQLVADAQVRGARRLAQSLGISDEWQRLLDSRDEDVQEGLTKMTLAIQKRDLADGVEDDAKIPGVIQYDTTYNTVAQTIDALEQRAEPMLSAWRATFEKAKKS